MATLADYGQHDAEAAKKRQQAGGGAPINAPAGPMTAAGSLPVNQQSSLSVSSQPAAGAGQTLAGTNPGVGDVKPGPTVVAPATPAATPAAAPAATPVDHKDPSWAAKGVDFGKIESGAPVPGQPGATFVHNGQGWTIQQGGAAPSAPGAPGAPAADPNAPPATVADAFKKTLMDKLNQGPVSLDDPNLKAQSDAFKVGQTRASEAQRAQAAERLASQGLASSGASDSAYSGILERQGERQSGFDANLVGDAAKQQADEIRAYMLMAGDSINQQEGRDLQDRLAQLDAQIRNKSIDQQGSLGQADIALRGQLGSGQLNLGLLQALLQNQQFGQGLSQQGAQFGAGLDQAGILGLLGLL